MVLPIYFSCCPLSSHNFSCPNLSSLPISSNIPSHSTKFPSWRNPLFIEFIYFPPFLSLFLYSILSFTPNHAPSFKIAPHSSPSHVSHSLFSIFSFQLLSLASLLAFIKSMCLFVFSHSHSSCTLASLLNFCRRPNVSFLATSTPNIFPSFYASSSPKSFPLSQFQYFPSPYFCSSSAASCSPAVFLLRVYRNFPLAFR